MKSLCQLLVVQFLPQIYQNNRENFFSALGEIFEALILHEEVREPILKTAAGVTIEIDGEHHCLLDFFKPTSLYYSNTYKANLDAIISRTVQQLINASTQVYFFEKEHDIIFALAHSVYGQRLLSKHWPTDNSGSNRCANMLNQRFLFGQYKGVTLSLYCLLDYNEFTQKIGQSQSFRASLTVDSLNEIVTQPGDFHYLSLALGLSVCFSGRKLLTYNAFALGKLITEKTLNAIVPSGHFQGQSVAILLASTPEGIQLLAHNEFALGQLITENTLKHIISSDDAQDLSVAIMLAATPEGSQLLAHNECALGKLISSQTLNAIISRGRFQGLSVAFLLGSTPEGRRLLAHNEYALGQLISKQTLNHIIRSGDAQDMTVAFWLAVTPEGRGLLAHNKCALGQLISKQTLNTIIPSGRNQGLSVAFVLAGSPEGRRLLAHNECALGQRISEKTLNAIISRGRFRSLSVAFLLVNSEDGKLIIKHNNYHLGKCITIEELKYSGMPFFSTMRKHFSAKREKRTDETATGTEKGINNNNSCRLM